MRVVAALVASAALLAACGDDPFPSFDEEEVLRGLYKLRTPPPSPTNRFASSAKAAALGEQLFQSTAFSACGRGCASCHPPPNYTLEGVKSPRGCTPDEGAPLRNTPSVVNAAFRRWFYWDGRKDTLWAHAALPLERPTEMSFTPDETKARMAALFASEYTAAFGTSPSADAPDRVVANFGKAIEAHLRTLVRNDSKFDDSLLEFLAAVDEGSQESHGYYLGLKTFFRRGRCVACHRGNQLTDDLFHNLGVAESGPEDLGRLDGVRLLREDRFHGATEFSDNLTVGRSKLAGLDAEEADLETNEGAFKTASLRNLLGTKPYFHNGSRAELADVIEFYDSGGDPAGTFRGTRTPTLAKLGLTPEEKEALLGLLHDLTDPRTLP